MEEKINNNASELIEASIYVVRGCKVILDEDLAKLYGVSVKRLNEQVKRNIDRFPSDFLLHLSENEILLRSQNATLRKDKGLRSQIVTSRLEHGKHRKYLPYAFTEQGVAMLSGLIRSPQAIAVNIEIMRAFVRMRHTLASQNILTKEVGVLRTFMLKNSQQNTAEFRRVWKVIEELSNPPKEDRKIGFKLNHDESV